MGLYANRPIAVAPYMGENALIAVGVLMLGSAKKIRFDDLTELVPAFVTIIMMLLHLQCRQRVDGGTGRPSLD